MRNLGEYIIPQLFTSVRIKYYHLHAIDNLDLNPINYDLFNERININNLELENYINFHIIDKIWILEGYINHSNKIKICWSEDGKFLRIE